MKKISVILVALVFLSCAGQPETTEQSDLNADNAQKFPDFEIALTFINDYVSFCSPGVDQDTTWIQQHELLTDNFKTVYANLLDSAFRQDPESGLGFDPIFDAQDFPEKGFILKTIDSTNGYVTVKGNDWPEFLLVLKVVEQNGKSRVDGSGVINIPADKKAKR